MILQTKDPRGICTGLLPCHHMCIINMKSVIGIRFVRINIAHMVTQRFEMGNEGKPFWVTPSMTPNAS